MSLPVKKSDLALKQQSGSAKPSAGLQSSEHSTVGTKSMRNPSSNSSELVQALRQLEHHDHEASADGVANLPQKMILKQIAAAIEPMTAVAETEMTPVSVGRFLGLLGRCKIQGCNVHEIDCEHDMIKHYQTDAVLPEAWEKARKALLSLGGEVLGCEVYENEIRIIYREAS